MGIIASYQKTGLIPKQVIDYLANYFFNVKPNISDFLFFY